MIAGTSHTGPKILFFCFTNHYVLIHKVTSDVSASLQTAVKGGAEAKTLRTAALSKMCVHPLVRLATHTCTQLKVLERQFSLRARDGPISAIYGGRTESNEAQNRIRLQPGYQRQDIAQVKRLEGRLGADRSFETSSILRTTIRWTVS